MVHWVGRKILCHKAENKAEVQLAQTERSEPGTVNSQIYHLNIKLLVLICLHEGK